MTNSLLILAALPTDWAGYSMQFVAAVGVSFLVLVLLASHLRYQRYAKSLAGDLADEMDPESALHFQILQRLGTAHREPSPFCLFLIEAVGRDQLEERHGADTAAGIRKEVLAATASVIRKVDFAVETGDGRVAAVLNTDRAQGKVVLQRALTAAAARRYRAADGSVLPVEARGSLVSVPENGDRVNDLIQLAEEMAAQLSADTPLLMAPTGGEEPAEAGTESTPDSEAPAGPRSLVDELTGVLRTERLPTALRKYVARHRKNRQPVSILYIDVDHLDKYNEHYSREAGDQILKGLGRLFDVGVREDDLIGRYAGDEFVVVMACTPDEALVAAHRLTALVKKTSFTHESAILKTTVSIGVAGSPDHGVLPRPLFEAAEAALYAAKRKGRGYAMVYEADMPVPPARTRKVESF